MSSGKLILEPLKVCADDDLKTAQLYVHTMNIIHLGTSLRS